MELIETKKNICAKLEIRMKIMMIKYNFEIQFEKSNFMQLNKEFENEQT